MRYSPDEQLRHLGFGALYLHGAAYGYSLPTLVVAWSLEIEVQFYILMPLFALVFLVRNPFVRRAILAAGMILPVLLQWINIPPFLEHATTALVWRQPRELGWWQHIGNYIQFFFAGILMADVYVVSWKSKPRPAWWGDLVWLLGWPALFYLLMLPKERLAPRVLFAPVVCILYLSLFRSRISRWIMSWPLIATIGGMCYSIYLVHLPVIQLIAPSVEYVREGHSYFVQLLIVSGIMVPTILIACGLFYRLVERPCMRRDWPIRLWNALFVPTEPARKEISR
jgi:peptidoglycan/LPS O-acetylase OafA/YrhL